MLVNLGNTIERIANDITEFEMNNTIGHGARTFRDQCSGPFCPALAYLLANFETVDVAREGSAQHIGEFGHRRKHLQRMAVRKDEPRVRVDIAKGVQRKNVI